MKTKIIVIAAAVAVVGGIIAGALFTSTPTANKMAPETVLAPAVSPLETNSLVTPGKIMTATEVAPPRERLDAPNNGTKPADVAQTNLPITINGYELQDPMARIALNLVGADADADAYWIGAINDSALPAEERKDLIEDLNEDGLSDPRHPSAQDMPLILRRIRLIEQLAPNALDEVNRDAFAEAYKDLVGLLRGEPPQ